MDGASPVQTQRHVIVPQMSRIYALWAIVIVITSFTGLTPLIIALTNGGPGNATMEVGLRLYQAAFSDGQYGYASAIGLATLAVVAIVIGVFLAGTRLWTWSRHRTWSNPAVAAPAGEARPAFGGSMVKASRAQ